MIVEHSPSFVVALLAAGAGRRFGSQKLVAPLAGTPLLWRALDAVAGLRARTLLVTGSEADSVENCYGKWREARGVLPFEVVRNVDWEEGLSTSLKLAAGAAFERPKAPWLFVVLADQPFVSTRHLGALVRARDEAIARGGHCLAVASRYQGKNAVPALLSPALAAGIALLRGDTGARDLLNGPHADGVLGIDLEGAWIDVDSPADAARCEAALRGAFSAARDAR